MTLTPATMSVVSHRANALMRSRTMNRMVVTLWPGGRRGCSPTVGLPREDRVRLRPEIASIVPYRQGARPPRTRSSSRRTRTRSLRCPRCWRRSAATQRQPLPGGLGRGAPRAHRGAIRRRRPSRCRSAPGPCRCWRSSSRRRAGPATRWCTRGAASRRTRCWSPRRARRAVEVPLTGRVPPRPPGDGRRGHRPHARWSSSAARTTRRARSSRATSSTRSWRRSRRPCSSCSTRRTSNS